MGCPRLSLISKQSLFSVYDMFSGYYVLMLILKVVFMFKAVIVFNAVIVLTVIIVVKCMNNPHQNVCLYVYIAAIRYWYCQAHGLVELPPPRLQRDHGGDCPALPAHLHGQAGPHGEHAQPHADVFSQRIRGEQTLNLFIDFRVDQSSCRAYG